VSVDPLIGTVVAGHRIEAVIGRGAMGVVYRVTHVQLKLTRALKLLPAHLAEESALRDRFEREWRAAAMIEHPSIVEVLDAGEEHGRLYIVMRFVEGTDLGVILRNGPLDPHRALRILEPIASALDAAHARGLIHRDVKPSNILVGPDDRSYLSDFGIAKSGTSHGLTKPGAFLGTIDYAAPEQFQGGGLDARTDVYSLGGVLFSCLTGGPPFERETDGQVMHAHLVEPPPRVSESRPLLPPGVDHVIATAMDKRKEARYASAGALVAAFRAELRSAETVGVAPAAEPPAAPPTRVATPEPPPSAPPEPPPERRRRTGLIAAAVAAIALLAGAGIAAAVALSGDDDEPVAATTAGGTDTSGGDTGGATTPGTTTPGTAVGEQIVVASGGDLLAVDPDGGTLARLTGGGGEDSSPACSQDGDRIAFGRDGDIFVMTRTGEDVVNLTNSPERENAPAWSPDGSRLAFDRQADDGTYDVWTMQAGGGGQRNLTGGAGESGGAPQWSPDGERIVFQRRLALWEMGADGSGKSDLTGDSAGTDLQPSWTPSARIAYARFANGAASSDVHVMQPDGGGDTNVTRGGAGRVREPAWSPDGASIAFANADGVSLVGADGSGLKSVARLAGAQGIAWCARASSP
jgi:serine/threonine protein kinase